MKTIMMLHQGSGVSRDEWRLQWRTWGTWLVGLFFLAVVLGEHPFWGSISGFSINYAANVWADRVTIVGSLLAVLTVPFALDRVRRQRLTPIEFSKPFEKLAYVLGKFAGAVLPLFLITLVSMCFHIVITLAAVQKVSLLTIGSVYFYQALLIAFLPLFYAASLTYCLSVYLRKPIIIIPAYLFYLTVTTVSQTASDAKFTWISPIVRPEYFEYVIPSEWVSTIINHQILYLVLSIGLLGIAVYGFQRKRFMSEAQFFAHRKRFRLLPFLSLGVKIRMLLGGHMIAALLMAFIAVANTMSNPEIDAVMRVEYVLFNLEFYLPVSGLLILAGVIARDRAVGVLDLVLTKPVNRWRLLIGRLLPALAIYSLVCMIAVGLLHAFHQELPLIKAFLTALSSGIFLGFIGLTAANISHNALMGYGAGLIYWFFEASFDGRFTAPFYMLIVSNYVDQSAGEVWRDPFIWLPVKVGMLIFAVWLFILNGKLLDAGEPRRRTLIVLAVSIPLIFLFGWWLMPNIV